VQNNTLVFTVDHLHFASRVDVCSGMFHLYLITLGLLSPECDVCHLKPYIYPSMFITKLVMKRIILNFEYLMVAVTSISRKLEFFKPVFHIMSQDR
jgi:hypothetical protein